MEGGVVSLAERRGDGRLWTVTDMLQEAVNDLPKLSNYNKAILLLLDDRNGNYNTKFYQAGMVKSQIVALLEVCKAWFVMALNGFEEDEEG